MIEFVRNISGGLLSEQNKEVEKQPELRRLDLQFFGGSDDQNGTDDDLDDLDDPGGDSDDLDDPDDTGGTGDDQGEDEPDLEELLQDKRLRRQHTRMMRKAIAKRLRKYKDVDLEEYEQLKAAADKGDSTKDKNQGSDNDDTAAQKQQHTKALQRAERREKRALIKEHAIDNGYNPKLMVRLIDLNELDIDENGDPENLDDLVFDLEDEFPEYFGAYEENDEAETKRRRTFTPGSRQKSNKRKKVSPQELGRQKALERHSKQKED